MTQPEDTDPLDVILADYLRLVDEIVAKYITDEEIETALRRVQDAAS